MSLSPAVAATNPMDQDALDPILSPILKGSPYPLPTTRTPRPEFAELLTPAKLRRKRRHGIPNVILPPAAAGPSRGGWQTGEGDVYRGASLDPTLEAKPVEVEDEAVTFSSSSSGSTWSIVSDLERGRRRTVAALERLGERIGVRRGSDTSTESSVGSSRLDRSNTNDTSAGRAPRRRSMSRRLARTLTRRSSIDSTPDAPRREYIPRKREFVLLLPEGEGDGDRVISTPELGAVLDAVKGLRVKMGLAVDSPAPSRGGSGRGYPRRPIAQRNHTSFARPTLPIRPQSGFNTPLLGRSPLASPLGPGQQLSTATPKPKSVSDLLSLPSPASAPNLTRLISSFPSNPIPTGPPKTQGAWWLDVSCPTWEDLRDIGELLSLHPLTLEDVLQQDPREKLDMFDKLGYYFVVIRALDETYFKYTPGTGSVASIGKVNPSPAMSGDSDSDLKKEEKIPSPELPTQNEKHKEGRRRGWGMGRAVGKLAGRYGEKVEIVEDNPGREGLEGVGVGAVNVYLAVFEDGVISFHYEDISKHTVRVRDRILSLAGGVGAEHTSDWVAHGLIDSIVDAFFPLIRYVDGEVDDIDSLTIDPSVEPKHGVAKIPPPPTKSEPEDGIEMDEKSPRGWTGSPDSLPMTNEKPLSPSPIPKTSLSSRIPRLHLPRLPHLRPSTSLSPSSRLFPRIPPPVHQILHFLIYLRLFLLPISSAVRRRRHGAERPLFDRMTMLRRITELKRLVTGLTRLLGAKHQVIGRMRKRAGAGLRSKSGGQRGRNSLGMGMGEGNTVEAYIGDVEDHILLLQTSLQHYEYILSHCQPAYLSHLHVSFHATRGSIATNILILSVVTISILPLQFVTGCFSLNIRIPRDGDRDHLDENGDLAGLTTFGCIVGAVFLVSFGMVTLIRWWRWNARKKFSRRRGVDVPSEWDGYWGWK